MKQYLITDFDGTINVKNDINSIKEIVKVISEHYKVVLATGRSVNDFFYYFPVEIKDLFDFMIFSNGAIVLINNEYEYNTFNVEDILYIQNNKIFEGIIIYELFDGSRVDQDNIKRSNYSDVIKIQLIIDKDEDLYKNINIASAFEFQILLYNNNIINLYATNVNKYMVSKRIIDRKGGTVKKALGDGYNDLSFLKDEKIETLLLVKDEMQDIKKKIKKFVNS